MFKGTFRVITILAPVIAALISAGPASAQTAPLSQASMGHLHLSVQDIEANKKFWLAMGGTPTQLGNAVIEGVKFGDVEILLRKNDSPAPAIGSVINHFGLSVPNVQDALAKWKA